MTDARTTKAPSKHGPGCTCTRCAGFTPGNEWRVEPGNSLSVKHAAYSARRLSERAAEVEPPFRADFQRAADEALLRALAEAVAQSELGIEAMARVGSDPAARLAHVRLSEDARGWIRLVLKLLDRAGGTPAARSEMARRTFDLSHLPVAVRARVAALIVDAEEGA